MSDFTFRAWSSAILASLSFFSRSCWAFLSAFSSFSFSFRSRSSSSASSFRSFGPSKPSFTVLNKFYTCIRGWIISAKRQEVPYSSHLLLFVLLLSTHPFLEQILPLSESSFFLYGRPTKTWVLHQHHQLICRHHHCLAVFHFPEENQRKKNRSVTQNIWFMFFVPNKKVYLACFLLLFTLPLYIPISGFFAISQRAYIVITAHKSFWCLANTYGSYFRLASFT